MNLSHVAEKVGTWLFGVGAGVLSHDVIGHAPEGNPLPIDRAHGWMAGLLIAGVGVALMVIPEIPKWIEEPEVWGDEYD